MRSRKSERAAPSRDTAGLLGVGGAEGAMLAAVRAIGRRDHTEAELRRVLRRRFDADAVEAAIAALVRKGWAGDERVAPVLAEREQRQRPASAALVREKLIVRGVAESIADRAARDASADRTDAERMDALLRQRFAGKGDDASRRRALSLLARRGFEEDDALAAVERVLGGFAALESDMSDMSDIAEGNATAGRKKRVGKSKPVTRPKVEKLPHVGTRKKARRTRS